MAFRIMLVGTSNNPVYAVDPRTGNWFEFETGGEAQAQAKHLAESGDGSKWRVKRVLDTKWKSRERNKFENGTYEYLPWEGASWWNACRSAHQEHFAHPSRSIPGMIAYTESVDKGMDNKQTQIKPGRYLEKFRDILELYGVNAKKLATDFEKQYRPRKVHFAQTEDEIQWVYEKGPTSCMSGPEHRAKHGWGWPAPGAWPLDTHACRMYATGEDGLAVAYLTHNDEPKGRVEARALVWPKMKTHSRCYGAESALRKELGMLGYVANAPIGAKIQRREVTANGSKLFLVPYIDVGQQAGAGATAVKDCKTHLEIVIAGAGTYPANSTSGLCGHKLDRNGRPITHHIEHCQACGDHNEDVGGLYPVNMSSAGADAQYWCANCIERTDTDLAGIRRGAYNCQVDGRYYSWASHPPVIMHNGEIWSQRAFRGHGFKCDGDGKCYPSQMRVRMFNQKSWNLEYFRVNGFTCWWTGDHFPNSHKVVLAEGKAVSKTAFDINGFVCEGCNRNFLLVSKMKPRGLCPRCTANEDTMASKLRNFTITATEEYACE